MKTVSKIWEMIERRYPREITREEYFTAVNEIELNAFKSGVSHASVSVKQDIAQLRRAIKKHNQYVQN